MIIHMIDTLEAGGAQALIFELASRISGSTVYSLRGLPAVSPYHWESLCHPDMPRNSPRSLARSTVRLLRICISARREALIVAHLDFSTVILCFLRPLIKFRLFVMVHASPAQWPGWYRFLFRRAIRFADLVIGGGKGHRELLVREGVNPARIALVGTASPLQDAAPKPADRDTRTEFGIPADAKVVLNVARMVRGKGQSELVRAISLIERPNVVAIIVGDGPEETQLRTLATELGVANRIVFPGRRTDLHNFYRAASAFAMPCLDESMGVVIIEALAYRIPVIAYDSGCIGEFIRQGENGILLLPDARRLAEAIVQALDAPERFRFSYDARFSMNAMVERFRRFCVEFGRLPKG